MREKGKEKGDGQSRTKVDEIRRRGQTGMYYSQGNVH